MRGMKALGTSPVLSPRKSLICGEAISSAMPLMNPMVTGRGMNLTAEPKPVIPISTSMIRDGLIAATGNASDVPIPADAERLDLAGHTVRNSSLSATMYRPLNSAYWPSS